MSNARIAFALALLAAGASQAWAARPRHVAPPLAPAAHSNEYSYRDALGAVWNYRSCGVRGRAAAYRALDARLRSIEAGARAKGLGPILDRVREDYDRILSVSTMMGCAGGPAAGLANARRALAAFESWVASARP